MIAALAIARPAPAPADEPTDESPEARLKFMRESVEGYRVVLGDERSTALRLRAEPAFRLGKQAADIVEEGAIFFWTGAGDRPEAAVQVFLIRDDEHPKGLWLHEFTSLAAKPLTAERHGRPAWAPRSPGVVFRPVPDAPKPGNTPALRARQMNALAQGFHASDDFRKKGWSELRLLPKAIARYGGGESAVSDGALYAFVLNTDPEVFLFLEARPGKADRPEWQYALAPMSAFALKGTYRGEPVWEVPDRLPTSDPSKPFYDAVYRP